MSTQKHLFQFAAVSILFVVLLGSNDAVAKDKQHKSHNTTLEHKKISNKRIKHNKKITKDHNKPTTHKLSGTASYYGYESGNKTATGESFKPLGLTAAHRTLPLNSKVRVTNLKNNKSVVLRINDRGPYARGRVIDLSLGAARVIGLKGTGPVSIEVL